MALLTQYDSTITNSSSDLSKMKVSIVLYFNCHILFLENKIRRNFDKINRAFEYSLSVAVDTLTRLKGAQSTFVGKDLSIIISTLEDILQSIITSKENISKIIKLDKNKKFETLIESDIILEKNIEAIYDILRILKRLNKKEPFPTSQLAIDSARRSANTLQKVMYGH